MDLITDTGKSLLQTLTTLLEKYPGSMGPLQRAVYLYSPEIKNEDKFITVLFPNSGQVAILGTYEGFTY